MPRITDMDPEKHVTIKNRKAYATSLVAGKTGPDFDKEAERWPKLRAHAQLHRYDGRRT
jgi:hypothetical protein